MELLCGLLNPQVFMNSNVGSSSTNIGQVHCTCMHIKHDVTWLCYHRKG